MFLKVEDTKGGWWVFECYKIHYHEERVDESGSKKISCCRVNRRYWTGDYPDDPKGGWSSPKEEDWIEWKNFEWDVCILKDDPECNPRSVVVSHLGTNQDQEYIVVFDTEAYLCNDKGETIEKIEP